MAHLKRVTTPAAATSASNEGKAFSQLYDLIIGFIYALGLIWGNGGFRKSPPAT